MMLRLTSVRQQETREILKYMKPWRSSDGNIRISGTGISTPWCPGLADGSRSILLLKDGIKNAGILIAKDDGRKKSSVPCASILNTAVWAAAACCWLRPRSSWGHPSLLSPSRKTISSNSVPYSKGRATASGASIGTATGRAAGNTALTGRSVQRPRFSLAGCFGKAAHERSFIFP